MKLSVIVSYCSLDLRFIKPLLNQLLLFSDDVIVVYFDKLLNGQPEPVEEVWKYLSIDRNKIRGLKLKYDPKQSSRYHHNLARWEASAISKHENLLFLDADEIPDGVGFKQILDSGGLNPYHAAEFRCYWYFRSAKYQAVQTENCGLYLKKKLVNKQFMFTEMERWSYRQFKGINYGMLLETNTGPLLHHFSWVRTKDEMIKKVSSWGHRHDRDWNSQIQEEFSREFNGTDFVHGYSYNLVDDKFLIGL